MILIVDDNATERELTTIAIEATGRKISVRYAKDGKSALSMLRNGHKLPDLILLDLKMPGMSGIEVLHELRGDDRLRDLPVVVVTSSALESDRAEATAAGASGYIKKPHSLTQFSKELESFFHRWLPD